MKNASVFDNSYPDFFVEHLKFQKDTQLMKSKHYHDFYEIYYYLGNSMNYFIENKNYTLEKNNIMLIDKYAFHKTTYNPNDENERILIEFTLDVFDVISDKSIVNVISNLFHTMNKIEILDSSQCAIIHSLIIHLVSSYNSPSPYGTTIAKLNLIELCLILVQLTASQDTCTAIDINSSGKSTSIVVDIIKFINENYSTKITLEVLANQFYVNKYYLCHIFKNETGMSIIDYINSRRLFEAEKLLRQSSCSITEICYKVGFSSINHFLNLFKDTYKLSPKKFRDSIDYKPQ